MITNAASQYPSIKENKTKENKKEKKKNWIALVSTNVINYIHPYVMANNKWGYVKRRRTNIIYQTSSEKQNPSIR
jgi:hypothetical protein